MTKRRSLLIAGALVLLIWTPARPVLAVTPRPETYRRLSLVRGVTPILLPGPATGRAEIMAATETLLRKTGWEGKRVVLTSRAASDRHIIATCTL